MREKEIRKYIDWLNNGKGNESIFTRPISNNVEVAKVWSQQPKVSDKIVGNFGSYRFFFIKDDSGKYIGAVLDMYHDLHWYIVPGSRKQGYLTKALLESILPYLFYDERGIQRITINNSDIGEKNYSNSKQVAMGLGFKPINEDETEFELKKEDFNWEFESFQERNRQIAHERVEELKKRAFYAYKMLYKISDELLMAYNDDKYLIDVAKEVSDYTWKIEDLEWEHKKL